MFRPPVVARPLPDPKDLFQGSRGQGLQGGKALQKAAVIGEGLLHPGLLQKDLGDQDAVRVLPPPGEGAGVFPVPGEEGFPPGLHG